MTLTSSTVPHPDDTIVAVSSPPGPGARAIVRISGPNARSVVGKVFLPNPPAPFPEKEGAEQAANPAGEGLGRGRYLTPGSLKLSGVHSPLPATLYFFRGPRSYTGQDLAELHTIGSPPLVERLVADLLDAGARPANPGEFTLRAFLAGKKDLPEAEAVHAVIEAGTDADLRTALAQLAGGVSRPLESLRDDLLNLLADLEAALDFADEDIEFVGKKETLSRIDAALAQLAGLLRQLDERTISGRPVRVALVGRPNAGKSSLFNTLAGGEAIVSPIPGTTRDYLTKRLEVAGIQAELIDTAGWQDAEDTIEEQAQYLRREQEAHADVILWCDEQGEFPTAEAARLEATGAEVIRVWTKADLLTLTASAGRWISASAVAEGGVDTLLQELAARVASLVRPALAPSQSRCRHHIAASADHLQAARTHTSSGDPPELTASALRAALDQLGEVTGAIFTNDLLDRIFSRFCIGK
ncbi:MAG TPA: GTPase [Gemmata sp.]|nr:GTPase [Gemmata sp.]